jgi:peptidoglycan L-alanyl-D-glutamate endopeptidase CwlK
MTFTFSQRSLDNLAGVHPDLVEVMTEALKISPIDFGIIEGLRTLERQKELFAAGKSQTMHSRHLTGKAVDFAAYIDGAITWENHYYEMIAHAVKIAAEKIGVKIVWGGDWTTFKDMDHIELERHAYPDEPLVA